MYVCNCNQGRSSEFSSFKPATRMLLIYDAYQLTLVKDPGFADRKLTLVGPLSYIQLTLMSILFPNFYTILSTQIPSCVRVSFYNVRPRESLGTCVQNSSVNYRGFLAQNSWTTLFRVLVRMKKRDHRKLPCSRSRTQVRLDASHATN